MNTEITRIKEIQIVTIACIKAVYEVFYLSNSLFYSRKGQTLIMKL